MTSADLSDTTLATAVGALVGLWAGYALVISVTVRAKGTGSPARDLGWRIQPVDWPIGVAAGLLSSIVVVNVVYVVLQRTGVLDREDVDRLDEPAQRLADLAGGPGFVVLAAFVGIGAPIAEEVFFRGFLQPAAIRRLGVPGGIVLTALVFGAVHFQALQFPALAVFGLVLGWLAHRFGRLGPAIVTHMVFNGLTLAALAAS